MLHCEYKGTRDALQDSKIPSVTEKPPSAQESWPLLTLLWSLQFRGSKDPIVGAALPGDPLKAALLLRPLKASRI